jgi:hypothetical protein
MPLSIDNLLVSIGVAYDLQMKAADNLFYAAAVQTDDPSKPMFGGSAGTASGGAAGVQVGPGGSADGYFSINNGVEGDPIAVKVVSTPTGPLYKVVDGSGEEIMVEAKAAAPSGGFKGVPRYMVKSDGLIYDILNVGAGSIYEMPAGYVNPLTSASLYDMPVGRITFKAKEGASLTRATDEQQRASQVVQLLTRLLEGLQEEAKAFAQIIR